MMANKIKKIEEMNENNGDRIFYQCVNRMKKGFQPKLNLCKDKEGNIISEEEKILYRWAEYFEELLNTAEEEFECDSNETAGSNPSLFLLCLMLARLCIGFAMG
jgi:hypothetical protein